MEDLRCQIEAGEEMHQQNQDAIIIPGARSTREQMVSLRLGAEAT